MRTNRIACLSFCALAAASAHAQSFNVDIDSASGAGAGTPTQFYEGAADVPGYWNSIKSSTATTSTLKNLDGSASSATFTRATNGTFTGANLMIGDFANLYNDWQQVTGSGELDYSFNNLAAGTYLLYTYAHSTGTAGPTVYTEVEVPGAGGETIQEVGGFLGANSASEQGISHCIHLKTVSAGGSISVKIRGYNSGLGVVNGFQLVKLGGSLPIRKYVTTTGDFFADGDSWADAVDMPTALQFAAMVGGNNCEVWVEQGTYYTDDSTDRTSSFVIPSGLRFYGGFAGTETLLSQRTSPGVHATILSGEIGSVTLSNNAYNVVVADGCSTSTIIDGFTITHGYASGAHGTNHEFGGGMRIIGGSPVVRNCFFTANNAEFEGAALYVGGFSLPTFTNCIFLNNTCYNGEGGAVYSAGALNVRFVNCSFLGNYAVGHGGAAEFAGFGEMVNCIFSGNEASLGYGGAVYVNGSSANVTMRNCSISNNDAQAYGGVAVRNSATLTFANCITWGNTVEFSTTVLSDNLFLDSGTLLNLYFSTIQGAPGSAGADPKFVNAAGADGIPGTLDDNLRLQLSSPCIDAGDNTHASADVTDINQNGNYVETLMYDLDMQPRYVNINSVPDTGNGPAPVIDRGAYETPVPACIGDINGDGLRNTVDLGLLLQSFGQAVPANTKGDLDGNGVVNSIDLGLLLRGFGVPCL